MDIIGLKQYLKAVIVAVMTALISNALAPIAIASPTSGNMPDLRGTAPWTLLWQNQGTEIPDGSGHRIVVSREQQGAMYTISLAQARVAGRIDATYLLALRDVYAPLELVAAFETQADEILLALAEALGLNPTQIASVQKTTQQAIRAEGKSAYHIVVGKLIFHARSYMPKAQTQGWTLTALSISSGHALARQIAGKQKARLVRLDTTHRKAASSLRLDRQWQRLYHLAKDWAHNNPDSGHAWLRMGEAALELRQFQEAAIALDKGLRLEPGDVKQWSGLGYAQAQLRNHGEALKAYQHALERNPVDPEALYNLGVCYAHLGRQAALPGVHLRLKAADPVLAEDFFLKLIGQTATTRNPAAY